MVLPGFYVAELAESERWFRVEDLADKGGKAAAGNRRLLMVEKSR